MAQIQGTGEVKITSSSEPQTEQNGTTSDNVGSMRNDEGERTIEAITNGHKTDFTEETISVPDHSQEQEAQASYELHTLHPIKVQYDGTELCLFPPFEGDETFFVQDSSLAFSPCDQLLNACRDVLGESIGDGDELVLDFPSLGLHLTQVCFPCSPFRMNADSILGLFIFQTVVPIADT